MDDVQLFDQCVIAERNAEKFHIALRPLLDITSFRSVYTIKGRVKLASGIQDKVLRKRREGRAYESHDVKDASGFRIVCLFNAGIPIALETLLTLIRERDVKLSTGTELFAEPIAEIEIHSNRHAGDPLSIVNQVEQVVERRGLEQTLRPAAERAERFSSYSSVHVVLAGMLLENGRRTPVFTEIQIRSLFEEAWSEISHHLGYGPDKQAKPEEDDPPSIAAGLRWRLHLNALKSLADGCAQYADLIADEHREKETRSETDSQPRSLDADWRKSLSGLPRALLKAITPAFEARDRGEALAREREKQASQQAFGEAASAFSDILAQLQAAASAEPIYVDRVKSELAYCLMHAGNDDVLLPRAELLWREVLKSQPDSVAAPLRLGQLRERLGDFDEARALLERAEKIAVTPASVDWQQQLSLRLIYTWLGIVLWRLSERPLLPKSEQIQLLRLSAAYSERAFHINLTDDVAAKTALSYRKTVATNSTYCRAILFKLEPEARVEHLKYGRQMLSFLRTMPEYGAWSDNALWTLMKLDSVLRGEDCFGEPDVAQKVAAEIVGRIHVRLQQLEAGGGNKSAAFEKLTSDERDIYLTAVDIRDSLGAISSTASSSVPPR